MDSDSQSLHLYRVHRLIDSTAEFPTGLSGSGWRPFFFSRLYYNWKLFLRLSGVEPLHFFFVCILFVGLWFGRVLDFGFFFFLRLLLLRSSFSFWLFPLASALHFSFPFRRWSMRPLGLHRRLGPLSSSSSSSCYSSSSASSDWFRGLRPTRSGPFRTQVRPAKGQCSRSAGGAMSARLGSLRVHLSFSSRKSNSLDLPHSHFSPSYRDFPISTRFY